eukprot:gene1677-12744_t
MAAPDAAPAVAPETETAPIEKAGAQDKPIKIIILGDSAVGKSKLVEFFLLDLFCPQELSTYALTLHNYTCQRDGVEIKIDFWDTAGQERFNTMHPSYYHEAYCCILCFDVTRIDTYKNMTV